MKTTPISCAKPWTAMATPEELPPLNMMTPSRSIMRLAEARAASDLVWVSPVTYSTLMPLTPLPRRDSGFMVLSMPPSPSPLMCLTASL